MIVLKVLAIIAIVLVVLFFLTLVIYFFNLDMKFAASLIKPLQHIITGQRTGARRRSISRKSRKSDNRGSIRKNDRKGRNSRWIYMMVR